MKCGNPICNKEVITPASWKKQVKKYCCPECRLIAWVIRRSLKELFEWAEVDQD